MSRPGIFLDRDGTLNHRPADHAYLGAVTNFVWLPGAEQGAARLAKAGYVLAVASNQRGVSLGLVDPAALRAIEALIQRSLARHSCAIAAFRYCLHDKDANCDCRKPRPGMLLALARELKLDLRRSWMIGDSETDVLAGQAAGCRTALLGATPTRCEPDLVASSLDKASELIVGKENSVREFTSSEPHARAQAVPASNSWTSA